MYKLDLSAIFFDFDGVLVDSTSIKTNSYREIFNTNDYSMKPGAYPLRALDRVKNDSGLDPKAPSASSPRPGFAFMPVPAIARRPR